MDDYKPNSNRFKEAQASSEKNIQSVVSRPAKTKKKSEVKKFADVFLTDDIASVKSYVITDILIPAVKRFISDTVDAFLYPGGGPRRSGGAKGYNSYSAIYRPGERDRDRRDYPPSRVTRSAYDYDDISFDNRGDAEAVLTGLEEVINKYGFATVADLYDLAQISNHNYAMNNYGWTDIHTARVVPVRDGYMIKLPKALPMN